MYLCFQQIEDYVKGDDIDDDNHRSTYFHVRSKLGLKDDNEHYRQELVPYNIKPKLQDRSKMQRWLHNYEFPISCPSLLISGDQGSGLTLHSFYKGEQSMC